MKRIQVYPPPGGNKTIAILGIVVAIGLIIYFKKRKNATEEK